MALLLIIASLSSRQLDLETWEHEKISINLDCTVDVIAGDQF